MIAGGGAGGLGLSGLSFLGFGLFRLGLGLGHDRFGNNRCVSGGLVALGVDGNAVGYKCYDLVVCGSAGLDFNRAGAVLDGDVASLSVAQDTCGKSASLGVLCICAVEYDLTVVGATLDNGGLNDLCAGDNAGNVSVAGRGAESDGAVVGAVLYNVSLFVGIGDKSGNSALNTAVEQGDVGVIYAVLDGSDAVAVLIAADKAANVSPLSGLAAVVLDNDLPWRGTDCLPPKPTRISVSTARTSRPKCWKQPGTTMS